MNCPLDSTTQPKTAPSECFRDILDSRSLFERLAGGLAGGPHRLHWEVLLHIFFSKEAVLAGAGEAAAAQFLVSHLGGLISQSYNPHRISPDERALVNSLSNSGNLLAKKKKKVPIIMKYRMHGLFNYSEVNNGVGPPHAQPLNSSMSSTAGSHPRAFMKMDSFFPLQFAT